MKYIVQHIRKILFNLMKQQKFQKELGRGEKKITGKDFKFYEIDLLDYDALDNVFLENKIDAVIHFAGYKAVGESVEKPLVYYENNIAGSINLYKVMKEVGCKRIVFSSSATVYGDPQSVPIKEENKSWC